MRSMPLRRVSAISSAAIMLLGTEAHAQSLETQAADATQADIKALRAELDQRIKELDQLKHRLDVEEANFDRLSHEIETGKLDTVRGTGSPDVNGQPVGSANVSTNGGGGATSATIATGGATSAVQAAAADQVAQNDAQNGSSAGNQGGQNSGQPSPQQPVGQGPIPETAPPAVAPIFEQPGVLTPKGKLVVEPYFQFQYSSEDQLSLVGYTIIPALLIGLINVSEVRTTTLTGGVAFRYGLTNRLEFELRVPYVYQSNDAVERQVFTGTASNSVISSNGNGVGDVEMTMRYQLNQGGPDKFYYVGWLRFKTATGKSPFDVVTDCQTSCVANTTGTGLPLQQPTGSGFYAIQPGLTWLFPTDPVVFFGNFSYLHSFGKDESLTLLDNVKEPLGKVQPGDVYGFNVGMGLSLNEKASVSLGYDQSIVMTTKQDGVAVPGTTRLILGTLLLGYSYRLSPKTTLNFSIGAGLTRDTPDLTLTLRLPMSF